MFDAKAKDPHFRKIKVAVGMCTFRRSSLMQTLESLAVQTGLEDVECCVIIADNDETKSARHLVEKAQIDHPMQLHYVHAPAFNISVARNALLETAQSLNADFLAMIDDDETATPDWLRQLLDEIESAKVDVVVGKITAIYRPDTAVWLQKARPHDTEPVIQRDGRILNGYCGNVMLRLSSPFLQGHRFNPDLGLTGGEDDLFFRSMVRAGGTIGYAPDAVVLEEVPEARERLQYLLLRKFRAGQTHGLITQPDRGGMRGVVHLTKAASKATVLLAWAGLNVFRPERRMTALLRASLHAGVCSHLLGKKTLELYKS
ncbi:MAG: glycosyltransferase family 2 protein [Rhodobacterales bacterium]